MTTQEIASIITGEYHIVQLTRGRGEYIEVGVGIKGEVTSFYEQYPDFGGHYLSSYSGAYAPDVVNQLTACEWRIS